MAARRSLPRRRPISSARRFAARRWLWNATAAAPNASRARPSSRVSTRTPSHSSRLSAGARMCVSVTVLSTRTRAPVSIPAARAASSRPRLIRSQPAAPSAPIVACSADSRGGRAASTRAKRCADNESRSRNPSPR